SSSAQSKITSLPRDQAANKDQLKFGAWLVTAQGAETDGGVDSVLRDKEQLAAISGKFRICLGRRCYDRRRVAIGRPGEGQKPVQIPQAGDPFPLVVELGETRRPRQAATDRPDDERYASLP